MVAQKSKMKLSPDHLAGLFIAGVIGGIGLAYVVFAIYFLLQKG